MDHMTFFVPITKVDAAQRLLAAVHGPSRQMLRWNFMSAFGGTADIVRSGQQAHRFAVGTAVTGRPPHRTARAAFPHAAPTLGA